MFRISVLLALGSLYQRCSNGSFEILDASVSLSLFHKMKNHLFFLKCSHLLPSPLLPAGENIKRIQKQ